MNVIRKKLNNNTGSSIMIALGLVLICTMVSSVIVTAAVSGSSRNVNRTELQRSYLAVSSAGQALMSEFQSNYGLEPHIKQYVGVTEIKKYGCAQFIRPGNEGYIENTTGELLNGYVGEASLITTDTGVGRVIILPNDIEEPLGEYDCQSQKGLPYTSTKTNDVILSGFLSKVIEAASEWVYMEKGTYEETFYIEVQGEERLPKVKCKLIMYSNESEKYDIEMQLTTTEGSYSATITADGKVEELPIEKETKTDLCNHKIYYKKEEIPGSPLILKDGNFDISGEIEFHKTKVTWDNLQLKKGV